MAMVLVVAGCVGAGVWFAVRLERGLDQPARLARAVVPDRPPALPDGKLPGGSRTAHRAYPVRCAHGRRRPDDPNQAARHPVRRAVPGGARTLPPPRPHPSAPGRQIMSPDQQPTR